MSSGDNPYEAPATAVVQPPGQPLEGAYVTTTMVMLLLQTRPWVRFLSIMGFIGVGMIGLLGIVGGIAALIGGSLFDIGLPAFLITVVYLALAALYFVPVLLLHRYAGALKRLSSESTTQTMEKALRHQKSFWKFVGILSVVSLGLMVLSVIVGIVVADMSALP